MSYSQKFEIPGKNADEIFEKLSQDIHGLMQGAAFGKFEVKCEPEKRRVNVKASLFQATLDCSDGNMVVNAKLGLLAKPFKSQVAEKVEQGVGQWLKKAFSR